MATYGQYWAIPGLVATGSLASNQYYVVLAASTAGTVKVATTKATDKVIGILQNDPAAGEVAEVAFLGICKAAAETTVVYGERLTVSSTGRVKTVAADGDRGIGVALEASSAAGDIIRIIVTNYDAFIA